MSEKLRHLLTNWQHLAARPEFDTPLVRWSVVAIVTILVWFSLIEPIQQWRHSLQQQVAQNAKKAVRLVSLKEQAQSWAAAEKLAVTTLEQEFQALFMQSSDTAAQATIQTLLQKQCSEHSVIIESQKLLQAESEEDVGQKLAIAMNLRGDLLDMLRLLDDISNANRLLQVQRWMIRVDQKQKAVAQVVIAGFRGVSKEPADES